MKVFKVNSNDASQRIDKFLFKKYPNIPKSAIYKAFRKKNVKVNGVWVKFDYNLKVDDIINLYIKDELLESFVKEKPFVSPFPIDIVYEDDNIILINKPRGVLSQSTKKKEDSIVARLLNYLVNKGEYSFELENSFSPSICNRLDRNTCGLLIAAKNSRSLKSINQLLKNGNVKKLYRCSVHGFLDPPNGTLVGFIKKDVNKNHSTVFSSLKPGCKKIITKYKTIKKNLDSSLLEISLVTGRSHQIRAHLSFVGHPIIGDKKYGSNSSLPYFLESFSITFYTSDDNLLIYLDGKTFCI